MVLPDGQFRLMFTAQDYAAAVAFYRHGLELPLDHDWDFGPGDAGSVFKSGGGMVEVFRAAPGGLMCPRRGSACLSRSTMSTAGSLWRASVALPSSKSPRPSHGANAPFASAIPTVSV